MKTTKKAIRKAAEALKKTKAKAKAKKKIRAVTIPDSANIGICYFCQQRKPLLKSHIIPKFHMKKLVGTEKPHAYHISIPLIEGQKVWGEKRQDFHKRLFCTLCEGKFARVEGPYSKWWQLLRLDEKNLKMGMRYTIDNAGKWLEESIGDICMSPIIVLKGVDMYLLKKMQLINIFRLHCYLETTYEIADYPATDKYRRIIRRFLFPEFQADLDITHLADFSVEASYVFILSGEQCEKALVNNDSFDVLPATPITMGAEIMMHKDHSCFIGPILWRVIEKPDKDIEKDSLTMGSTLFHCAFPGIADSMVKYKP